MNHDSDCTIYSILQYLERSRNIRKDLEIFGKIMKIPQKYRLTKEISSLLATIEANKEVINNISVPVEIEENIRRQSILGSALFSARVEGNILTRGEISSFSDLSSRDQNKLEIANLHRAITAILEKFTLGKKITRKDILTFHRGTMKNILSDEFCGKFRKGHEGVFDSAGNLIYHSPSPSMVDDLVDQLVGSINSKRERLVPVKAVLAHLSLEDIHPFVDGSGRVGRLLQTAVLCVGGYGMKGLIVPEELIDNNRQAYYRAIEIARENSDATEFVGLMLEFIAKSSTTAKELLLEKKNTYSPLDLLPPRRREIVEIVRDHQMISLDFLHRRFMKISPRLLSYDLKCLMDQGFIVKIGKTRGALYAMRLLATS